MNHYMHMPVIWSYSDFGPMKNNGKMEHDIYFLFVKCK